MVANSDGEVDHIIEEEPSMPVTCTSTRSYSSADQSYLQVGGFCENLRITVTKKSYAK